MSIIDNKKSEMEAEGSFSKQELFAQVRAEVLKDFDGIDGDRYYEPEEIKKIFLSLPPSAQYEIEQKIQNYRAISRDIPESVLEAIKDDFIFDYESRYINKRYGNEFLNKDGVKHELQIAILQALVNNDMSILENSTRVMIDLNCLKAINDISSHKDGDRYLYRTAARLERVRCSLTGEDDSLIDEKFDPSIALQEISRYNDFFEQLKDDQEFKSLLFKIGDKNSGVRLSAEGGDEFGLFIQTAEPLSDHDKMLLQSFLKEALTMDCSDILKTETILEKKSNLKLNSDVPSDFRFRSTVAIGLSSLDDALLNTESIEMIGDKFGSFKHEAKKRNRKVSFKDAANILMEPALNVPDNLMIEDKKTFKKESMSPLEKELSLRNEEMVEMLNENYSLKRRVDDLENHNNLLANENKKLEKDYAQCVSDLEKC